MPDGTWKTGELINEINRHLALAQIGSASKKSKEHLNEAIELLKDLKERTNKK